MQKTKNSDTDSYLDHLKEIFEVMSDGVYIVNRNCDIEYVNPAIAGEFGAPGRQKCYKYFHGLKQRCPWCVNKDIFEGKSLAWQWHNPKTGRTYDLFDTPLRNPDGSISKLEFFHDVTGLIEARSQLTDAYEFLNRMIEQSPTPMWISDAGGNLIRINPACLRLLNITTDDVVGKYNVLRDNIVEEQGYLPLVENVFKNGELARFELRYDTEQLKNPGLRTKASVYLDVTIFPIVDQNGKVTNAVIQHIDITGRKKAEEELKSSEKKYRDIFENSVEGVFRSTLDGRYLSVNPAFARIGGFDSPEDMIDNVTDIQNQLYARPEDRERLVDLLRQQEAVNNFEAEIKRRDGQLVWISINVRLVKDADGNPSFLEGTMVDITARKTAEEALFRSEERYRTLVDNAAEAVFVIQNGKVVYANPKAFSLVNYRLDEWEPNYFIDFIHPDDRALVIDRHLRRLSGEEFEETYVVRLLDKENNIRWVQISSAGIKWQDNPATLTLATDITQQKKDEQEIEESGKRYRSLFENMLNGVAYCRMIYEDGRPRDFIYLSVNSAFEKLTGLNDVVGKPVTEVIPGIRESNPELFEIYGRVARTGVPEKFESFVPGLNIWFSVSAYSTEADHFVALFDNVTESKLSQEKLQKSYAALKKTLDDAINTMSRIVEMRDPYTAGHQKNVAALASAIAADMKLDEEQIERLRMAAFIHDIGKIYVPSDILSKPGKLDKLEFEIIKTHPQGGYDIIKGMDFPCTVAQAVLQHHERLDGSGYPNGLKGADISLEARILAVADVVEAMSAHRPYRPAAGPDKALAEIERGRGAVYDAEVVDACVRLFKEGRFKLK